MRVPFALLPLALVALGLVTCSDTVERVAAETAVTDSGAPPIVWGPSGPVFGTPDLPDASPGETATVDTGPPTEVAQADSAPSETTTADAGQEVLGDPDVGPPDIPEPDVPPEDDNGFALPTCGDDEVVVVPPSPPATILLVMDRSGSMEGEKWTQTKAAVGAVLGTHDANTRFGLLMFPSSSCSVASSPHVGFGLGAGQPIVDAMQAEGTTGSTPTAKALDRARALLASDPSPGPQVVILATDGKPNCTKSCAPCGCALGCDFFCFNEDQCTEDEVFSAVDNLAGDGVPVYVVGMDGSSSAEDMLNEIAEAGGTALPGPVKYYDTANGDELASALQAIAGSVDSCSSPLQIPPGAYAIVVEIDGQTVDRDLQHANGWDLLEGDVLQFYGDACDAAASDGADIEVTYLCKYAPDE